MALKNTYTRMTDTGSGNSRQKEPKKTHQEELIEKYNQIITDYQTQVEQNRREKSQKFVDNVMNSPVGDWFSLTTAKEGESKTDHAVKVAGATFADAIMNIGAGAISGFESTVQAGINMGLNAYTKLGIVDEYEAKKVKKEVSKNLGEGGMDQWLSETGDTLGGEYSLLNAEKSNNITQGIGNTLYQAYMTNALGLGNITLKAGGKSIALPVSSIVAGAVEGQIKADERGVKGWKALAESALQGGVEGLTEGIFDAAGLGVGGSSLEESAQEIINKFVTNKVANALAHLGLNSAGEGAEEILSYVLSHFGEIALDEAFKKPGVNYSLADDFNSQEMWDAAISAALSAGLQGTGNVARAIATNRNMATGLNQNETRVLDSLIKNAQNEANIDGKLTKRELNEIKDDITEKFNDGAITKEQLDKALNGNDYNDVTDTIIRNNYLRDSEYKTIKNRLENDKEFAKTYTEAITDALRSNNESEKKNASIHNTRTIMETAEKYGIDKSTAKAVARVANKLKFAAMFTDDKYEGGEISKGVYISKNAKNPIHEIIKHELNHFIHENADKEIISRFDKTMEKLADARNINIDRVTKKLKKQNAYKELSKTKMFEEISSIMSQTEIFSDVETIDEIVKIDRSTAQQIKNYVSEMYNTLVGNEEKALMRKAERMYSNALKKIKDNNTQNTEMAYMIDKNGNILKPSYSEDVKNAIDVLNMDSAFIIKENKFQKRDDKKLSEMANEFFDSLNNEVFREDLGRIELNKTGVNSLLAHMPRYVDKYAAIEALPIVIRDGKIIDVKENWKSRGKDTAIICAPITINNKRKYMGVVVEQYKTADNKNVYYTHDLIVTDINEKGTRFLNKTQASGQTAVSEKNLIPYTYNILKLAEKINQNGFDTEKYLEEDANGRKLNDEQADMYKNISYKLRDDEGRIKPFYHGTKRKDRVGEEFRPDRATSWPMAYFTDNPDIANNYSRDKADTSVASQYSSDYEAYSANRNNLNDYYASLNYRDKSALKNKALDVGFDDDFENLVFGKSANENSFGRGTFGYYLRDENNNPLRAMYRLLEDNGAEDKFTEALNYLLPNENVEFDDPNKIDPGVYEVYLNITNPFDTTEMPSDVIEQLRERAIEEDKTYNPYEGNIADMWDKHNWKPTNWMNMLDDDIKDGTTHAWTSVPDWVTDVLKENGYDGIVDMGGKSGGTGHQVAIPFYSNQIKSVTNQTPTNDNNINKSSGNNIEELNAGYHYDNGGFDINKKSETLGNRGGRGTGAFGTGNYFFGSQQDKNSTYGKMEEHSVDFSDYNLFRPKNANEGFKLHDFFKRLEDYYDRELPKSYSQWEEDFRKVAEGVEREGWDVDKVWDDYFDESIINDDLEWSDYVDKRRTDFYKLTEAEENEIRERLRPFLTEEQINDVFDENRWDDRVRSDYLRYTLEDILENPYRRSRAGEIEDNENVVNMIPELAKILGTDKATLRQLVDDAYHGVETDWSQRNYGADSFGTRIMKALGYEGIDVRGIDALDNSTYGSVIYDIKPDTVRYSAGNNIEELNSVFDETQRFNMESLEKTQPRLTKKERNLNSLEQSETNSRDLKGFFNEEGYQDPYDGLLEIEEQKRARDQGKAYENAMGVAKIVDEVPVKERDNKGKFKDIVMKNFVDHGDSFTKLANQLRKKAKDSSEDKNYYNDLADRVESGYDATLRANSMAQNTIGNKRVDRNTGEVVGESLNDIFKDVDKLGLRKQFDMYLYHNLNVDSMTLANRGFGANKPVFGYDITAEISQGIVETLEKEHPELIDLAKRVYEYERQDAELLHKSGFSDLYTKNRMEQMYPHYVPIYRVFLGENEKKNTDKYNTSNKAIKSRTGASFNLASSRIAIADHTQKVYKSITTNDFFKDVALAMGEDTSTLLETDTMAVLENIGPGENMVEASGENPAYFIFYDEGESHTFAVDESMWDAMMARNDILENTKLGDTLSTLSGTRRNLLTEWNPAFFFKNLIKDFQDAPANSKYIKTYFRSYVEAIKEIMNKGKLYQQYMALGGSFDTYFGYDKKFVDETKNPLGKALNRISELNNAAEMAPRLAEFINCISHGDMPLDAMLSAAEVTTNFKRGGDIAKMADRYGFTFLNASIQGAYKQYKNFEKAQREGTKGILSYLVKMSLIYGLPLAAAGAIWDDDEEYDELSDYIKQNYYIVGKYGNGKFIRIPKGRIAVAYQTILNNIKEFADDTVNGEISTENLWDTICDDILEDAQAVIDNVGISNPLENNILSPIVNVANNRTWYGDQLVPTRLQNYEASEQYDETTDELSKYIGKLTNNSPYKIHYLLDQYSGAIGDIVLPALTPKAENGIDGLTGKLLSPFISAFTADSVLSNQYVSDFYDMKDELQKLANKDNASDEAFLSSKYMNSVYSQMSKLYSEKRSVQNNPYMKDSEKFNMVRDIQRQIDDLAINALNTYDSIDVSGGYAKVGEKEYYKNDGSWTKINDSTAQRIAGLTEEQKGIYFSATEAIKNVEGSGTDKKVQIAEIISQYDADNATKAAVFSKYYDSNTTKVAGAIDVDMDQYMKYYAMEFSGKSKKQDTFDYISRMDIPEIQKAILFKMAYPSYTQYDNDIVQYVVDMKKTDQEKKDLLDLLGFVIDDNGNIKRKK